MTNYGQIKGGMETDVKQIADVLNSFSFKGETKKMHLSL